MKKIIKKLYDYFCKPAHCFGMPEDFTQLSDDDKKDLYAGCKEVIFNGWAERVARILVGEIEHETLYQDSKRPINTTQAEIRMAQIEGIERLFGKLEYYSTIGEGNEKPVDKFNPL